ncbi:diguanylate cyclase domain-containing protein [uncultured Cohaesibacter sp.]|uniref:diguanylate cyclase domain-containing protein n=1 Tax=uncultured Cohaesibacter sp. TaxID=1002546 RepID=UPI002AABBBCB|nr:diguanylate cyclase [uncultured Cohaesibacter sp.]
MGVASGRQKVNFGAIVIVACVGVFLALTFSNIFLLNRSGEIANSVRHEQERKLVEHELNNFLILFAHAQSQVSDWDASYDAFMGEIDDEFVFDNITSWLWGDFGILMTYVVTPANKTKVAVLKETRLKAGQGEYIIEENIDLVEEARAKFQKEFTTDKPMPAAQLLKDILAGPEEGRFAWSIRPVNGRLSYVIAQAVAPNRAVELGNHEPDVLFTVKQINKDYIAAASEKLVVEDFHFDYLDSVKNEIGYLPLVTLPDGRIAHARWTPDDPSRAIWQQTLPVLAVPFFITALALVAIAWRFSFMLRALQKSEEQNRFLALHDALTGLPNRLFFDRELEETILQRKQKRCAIISLDLDRFKAVNDNYGHQAGDMVLSAVSERISERLGSSGMASRVGGDEFGILLYDHLEQDKLECLCEDLIAAVNIPVLVPGGVAEVGASIGVARWPEDAFTVKAILRRADEALYISKQNGRGRVTFVSHQDKATLRSDPEEEDRRIQQLKALLARTG